MNWPRLVNVVILAAGVFLMAWLLQAYAASHLPPWAHYGLLLAFFLPLLWVSNKAEAWVAQRLQKPIEPQEPGH